MEETQLPVAVIGAGPVGMAAAAHLVQRGFTPIVLEAGTSVARNLETYRHVRLFSPWRYNLDRAALALLAGSDWRQPDLDALPTAGEMIDHYLQPLAALPALASRVKLNYRVIHVSRQGFDKVKTGGRDAAPFVVRVHTPEGEREFLARAVIDAAGTWSQPNPLGANGLPALCEESHASHIAYGMPDILGADRARYAGKRVLVVGAGHSAAGNLIALAELATQAAGTSVVWATRGSNLNRAFGGGTADRLPARGQLGTRLKQLQESARFELHANFRLRELRTQTDGIRVIGEPINGIAPGITAVDEIIGATGARPDVDMTRELRLRRDSWLESTEALAPLIDPNMHSCGTVRPHGHRELTHPETGYYAVGAKSYGRAPNFLMATGYEQVRSIVAALAGDMGAADDVQLELPETGVCSIGGELGKANALSGDACCGGRAPAQTGVCCIKDADEKARGNAGCGCSSNKGPARKVEASACCD